MLQAIQVLLAICTSLEKRINDHIVHREEQGRRLIQLEEWVHAHAQQAAGEKLKASGKKLSYATSNGSWFIVPAKLPSRRSELSISATRSTSFAAMPDCWMVDPGIESNRAEDRLRLD